MGSSAFVRFPHLRCKRRSGFVLTCPDQTRSTIQCYEHLILPGLFHLESDNRWLLKLRKHSIGQTQIVPSSLSHIGEQTVSKFGWGRPTGLLAQPSVWAKLQLHGLRICDGNCCRRLDGLWPFHKYKETFFVSRRAVICSTGFLIAAQFKNSPEFGWCLCPHLGPLLHLGGVLTFQGTCLASVRLPICS